MPNRSQVALISVALLSFPALAFAGQFDPVAATDAILAAVPPEIRARSDAYTESSHWVLIGTFLYGALAKWGLLRTGLSARIRQAAQKIGRVRLATYFFYGLIYVVALGVLFLPWQFCADFWRDHHFGMSNRTFGDWAHGLLGGFIQDLVFVPLLATAIFGFMALSPRRWRLHASLFGTALFAVKLVIAPLYLAPLFFTFTPLEAGEARDQILSLARANQVPTDQIFRFDLSKITSFPNAHVDGLGPTARISVSDNLLDHATLPEIRLVVGHEMGHYVLGHPYIMLLDYGVLIFLMFGLLGWAYPVVIARWGPGWGVREPADITGLPALMILILLYRLVLDPVDSAITRVAERQADLFALNATREADALPALVMKVAQRDKLAPGPAEEILFFDHPSTRSRVLAAMRWKAENLPNE